MDYYIKKHKFTFEDKRIKLKIQAWQKLKNSVTKMEESKEN